MEKDKVTRKKNAGAFYTPSFLAEFVVNHISNKLSIEESMTILEPSAGDGSFIKTLAHAPFFREKRLDITAVEKNKKEINKVKLLFPQYTYVNDDFLTFQHNNTQKYKLVIGNPPYIRKSLLNRKQLTHCKRIHAEASLSKTEPKNIWTSFLVRCSNFLTDNGVLAFVLPAEFLQVKFAQELRELLIKTFQRVEVFTFNELLFNDCKGQDTIVLVCEKKTKEQGVFYYHFENIQQVSIRNIPVPNNIHLTSEKWSQYHLASEEISLLEQLKKEIDPIKCFCESKPGIVTAANEFFILDKATVNQFSLQNFVKPVIKNASCVNGSLVFDEQEYKYLLEQSKPAYLLVIDDSCKINEHPGLHKYLKIGVSKNIHKRYKTSIRERWFEIPNICEPPKGFFLRRCDLYPKLIKNDANVLITDTAYIIALKDHFNIESLIYSFYNSLTLSFAEIMGRYYGGGLLELTPNEFKALPVGYVNINTNQFNRFTTEFKKRNDLNATLRINDDILLRKIIKDIDHDTIVKIQSIRQRLYQRRLKQNN